LSQDECGPGRACYTGRCEQIRHNVLLVFDTSASMWSYLERSWNTNYSPLDCNNNPHPCFSAFPGCDDEAAPLSLFTLSKNVFSSVVEEAIGGFSQFALMRFPQRDTPGVSPSCANGWYVAQDVITGDQDERSPDDVSWFKDNLEQVLVVPFPVRTTINNIPDLLSWIDHEERLGATPDSCVDASDCGEGGRCGDFNGERRCYRHTDPELRAISQPYGRVLGKRPQAVGRRGRRADRDRSRRLRDAHGRLAVPFALRRSARDQLAPAQPDAGGNPGVQGRSTGNCRLIWTD
jgi:hypothetical protein